MNMTSSVLITKVSGVYINNFINFTNVISIMSTGIMGAFSVEDLSAITVGIDPRTICFLLMVLAKSYKDIRMHLIKSAIYCRQMWNMEHSKIAPSSLVY